MLEKSLWEQLQEARLKELKEISEKYPSNYNLFKTELSKTHYIGYLPLTAIDALNIYFQPNLSYGIWGGISSIFNKQEP